MNSVMIGVLPVLLLLVVLFVAIVCVVTALIFKKEKKAVAKASSEAGKIDGMLAAGKISEDEAGDLKRAVGTGVVTKEIDDGVDPHVKVVGVLHIVNGVFLVLLTFALVFGFQAASSLTMVASERGGNPMPGIYTMHSLIPGAAFAFLIILSLLEILSGAFALHRDNWARYMLVAISIMILFSFPLGTALGAYSLWVLLIRDGAREEFIVPRRDELEEGRGGNATAARRVGGGKGR